MAQTYPCSSGFVAFLQLCSTRGRRSSPCCSGSASLPDFEISTSTKPSSEPGFIPPRAGSDPPKRVAFAQRFGSCSANQSPIVPHRGTSFSLHRDGLGDGGDYLQHVKVYRREGLECVRCAGRIRKTQLHGRGTTYCPDVPGDACEDWDRSLPVSPLRPRPLVHCYRRRPRSVTLVLSPRAADRAARRSSSPRARA